MKIGVVGTGIAGLSAAWLLAQEHDVEVFEKASTLGFESNSVDLTVDNTPFRVDVPLRLFDEKFYANLSQFYKFLGVDYTPANYCQSYSTRHDRQTYFRYFNYLIGRVSVPFVDVSKIFTWSYLLIMRDALRLYFLTPIHFRDPAVRDLTFGEYLDKYGFSNEFSERMILPTLSAMCTCSYENLKAYPADMILDLVITKISKNFSKIYCNTPVVSVHPHPTDQGKVCVVDHTGKEFIYDHVIVATQANHALKMISEPKELVETLKHFEYDKGVVYVHTDKGLMPKESSGWGNVSYLYDKELQYPITNIWMNQVVPHMLTSCKEDIFQTIFPEPLPAPSKTLAVAPFERPLMNKKVVKGIQQLRKHQGQNNIWFCGAHAAYGIPLQENALKSAIYVASSLGVKIPWQTQEVKVTPTYPSVIVLSIFWRKFLYHRDFHIDLKNVHEPTHWAKEYSALQYHWTHISGCNTMQIDPDYEQMISLNYKGEVLEIANKLTTHPSDIITVQSKQPFRPLPWGDYSVGYFEATMVNGGTEQRIGIGFARKDYVKAMPGWKKGSCGYHADDGRFFIALDYGLDLTEPWKVGDICGCGIDFRRNTVFSLKMAPY